MEHEPELVINAGDLVSAGKVYEQWKPQFFDPLAPLIRSVPIYTILGNHERNSDHYYSYFDLPNNEAWWTADFGVVHLIALDSCRQTGVGQRADGVAARGPGERAARSLGGGDRAQPALLRAPDARRGLVPLELAAALPGVRCRPGHHRARPPVPALPPGRQPRR